MRITNLPDGVTRAEYLAMTRREKCVAFARAELASGLITDADAAGDREIAVLVRQAKGIPSRTQLRTPWNHAFAYAVLVRWANQHFPVLYPSVHSSWLQCAIHNARFRRAANYRPVPGDIYLTSMESDGRIGFWLSDTEGIEGDVVVGGVSAVRIVVPRPVGFIDLV